MGLFTTLKGFAVKAFGVDDFEGWVAWSTEGVGMHGMVKARRTFDGTLRVSGYTCGFLRLDFEEACLELVDNAMGIAVEQLKTELHRQQLESTRVPSNWSDAHE